MSKIYRNCLKEHWSVRCHLVRFGSQGVMYSRHKCFISIFELRNPCMHSSRNSSVKWGSFAARRSLTLLMKMVLFDGMQRPTRDKHIQRGSHRPPPIPAKQPSPLSTSNSTILFRLRIRNPTTDFDQVRNKENQLKWKYQIVHCNGKIANKNSSRCLQFQAAVLRFSNQMSESRYREDCRLQIEDLGQSYRG